MAATRAVETRAMHRSARFRFGRILLGTACAALMATGCVTTVTLDEQGPTVPHSRAKRDLGIDYLTTGRTAMAIRELTASMDLDPTDPQTYLWLGEAYRRKGQERRAEVLLREALERAEIQEKSSQTGQEARLNLSALLSQMGRYQEALEHCEQLAEDATYSSPWRALNNCGWALIKLGRYDEARRRFDEALDYFPRYGPALLNRGILEARLGEQLAAIQSFERALTRARLGTAGRAEASFRLGEIYVALGRRDEAVKYFQQASELGPYLDWGTQSQAYLDLLR